MEIICNAKGYIINKMDTETLEATSARGWFIVKQKPESDLDFLEAERLSKIWYNIEYLGCTYAPEIQSKIKELSTNFYV